MQFGAGKNEKGKKEERKQKWQREWKWKRERRRWETVHTAQAAGAPKGSPKSPGRMGQGSLLSSREGTAPAECSDTTAKEEIKEMKRSPWVSRSCRADSCPG